MIEVTINVRNANDEPVTGLTADNIKFKTLGDVEITGLTVYEQGLGTYVITGFTTWQKTRLYIDGVLQNWWGIQYTGEPSNQFVDVSGDTMSGILNMGGNRIYNVGDPVSTEDVGDVAYNDDRYLNKDTYETHYNGIDFIGTLPKGYQYPNKYLAPSNNYDLTPKQYVDTLLNHCLLLGANCLLVDPNRSEDYEGYCYRELQSAIDYAYLQTPAPANRWTVYVLPNKNPDGYTTDFTLYDYIDLVGIGIVKLACWLTRSGSMSDKNSKVENFFVEVTDRQILIRKTRVYNCILKTTEDNIQTNISIEGSQLINCGLFLYGSGQIQSNQHGGIYNRYINCYGNFDIQFDTNDLVIDYNYNTSAEIQY